MFLLDKYVAVLIRTNNTSMYTPRSTFPSALI